MKCEKCGGNLSLEDMACPYCGTINKHARQHISDMKRYKGAFENTRSNVYTIARNYAGITVRAAIITGLLLLTVIFAVVASESYSIKRNMERSRANRNFEEYSEILDQYLAEENYMAFSAFCEAIYMDSYDTPYEKYAQVKRAGSQYGYLYECIMDAYVSLQDEDVEPEERAEYAERVAYQLNYFYETLDVESYSYYNGVDSEENLRALTRMEENVELLLQTYCGLTEEDVAELKSMTDARRTVLLEERLGYAE